MTVFSKQRALQFGEQGLQQQPVAVARQDESRHACWRTGCVQEGKSRALCLFLGQEGARVIYR